MLYEVFDEDFESIAEAYDTTPRMIQYRAEEQGWSKPINVVDKPQLDGSEEALEAVNERLATLQTIKQSALAPKYIALESQIISKTLEIIQMITAEDPAAAAKLKEASSILRTLREQNGMTVQSQNGQNGQGGNTLKIAILTAVGHKNTADAGSYEIEIQGGQSVAPRALPNEGAAPRDA